MHWQKNSGNVTLSFFTPLGNNDDGLRGFEVKDADGYLLYFGCLQKKTDQ